MNIAPALREALLFYANPDSYEAQPRRVRPVVADGGSLANRALEVLDAATPEANPMMLGVGIGYTLATGRLFCDVSDFHAFAEKLIAQPIMTHEFGDPAAWAKMRERYESLVTECGTRREAAQPKAPRGCL